MSEKMDIYGWSKLVIALLHDIIYVIQISTITFLKSENHPLFNLLLKFESIPSFPSIKSDDRNPIYA